MKRISALAVLVVVHAAVLCADTVLVGDFYGAGGELFSIGLPYLTARALNSAGACQAVTPTSSRAAFIAAAYDDRGMPRPGEMRALCRRAGADRYLLGRLVKENEMLALTVYLGDPRRDLPELSKAEAEGDESIQGLAAYAAGKVCPRAREGRPPRYDAAFMKPFSSALCLLREGDVARAKSGAASMAKRYPRSPDLAYLRGLVEVHEKKPYRALAFFNDARNLDPRFALPAYEEGRVWLSLRRDTLAEKAFVAAARIQPSFFEPVLQSGILKAARGDYPAAMEDLRRASALRPGDCEARYWRARCLSGAGKEREATTLLEAIAADNPSYGPALLLLGTVNYRLGDMPAAERWLRRGLRFCPDDAEGHRLLGETLSSFGNHGEAAREFNRALSLGAPR